MTAPRCFECGTNLVHDDDAGFAAIGGDLRHLCGDCLAKLEEGELAYEDDDGSWADTREEAEEVRGER